MGSAAVLLSPAARGVSYGWPAGLAPGHTEGHAVQSLPQHYPCKLPQVVALDFDSKNSLAVAKSCVSAVVEPARRCLFSQLWASSLQSAEGVS